MKDKFKGTKGLDNAYISLAKHYDKHKENAIRQIKEGSFVDLLNKEMEELQNSMKDKEKQIKEMAKVICNTCKTRVSEQQCNSDKRAVYGWCSMCEIIAEGLLKHYQPKLREDSVVLSRKEYEKLNMKYISAIEQLENKGKETVEKIITFIETLRVPEDGRHEWRDRHNDCIDRVILKLNQKFVNGVEIKENKND